jgi:cytochrome c oxidase cbb3-type subunit 3/ubiquinol-cytochrome c reductase cytochrome c subunit
MDARRLYGGILVLCSFALFGCDHYSGKPVAGAEAARPEEVKDFSRLYAQNCSACHGADGQHGPAIALANPEYQAIVDDNTLRSAITSGEPGTLMPAFAQSAGGMLTEEQVNILVSGMRSHWFKAGSLNGVDAPPYKSGKQGDAAHGQQVFTTYCASCHSTGVQQKMQPTQAAKTKSSSITDGSYLALISDQSLRAIIIAGRPDLGHPDWRSALPGHPMSDQDVTDVVAWIASQRQKTPGQPYPERP